MADRVIEELDEAESLRLISAGGIGRIAYQSRFGPAVLPVNYRWHDGAVVFRTARHSDRPSSPGNIKSSTSKSYRSARVRSNPAFPSPTSSQT